MKNTNILCRVITARNYTILKHDKHVQTLLEKLNTNSSHIQLNTEFFSKKKRLIAEIDLLIERKEHIEVYEVKCSYRITKAKKQLKKIKKLLQPKYAKPINLYFYHGDGDEIFPVI